MTLEQEAYYQNLMALKGRSASICAPGCSGMEGNSMPGERSIHAGGVGVRRQPSASALRENGQSARYKEDYPNNTTNITATSSPHGGAPGSSGSGGNMQIQNTTPTRPRKNGAHRSQSARVIGSSRPKVKRRERDIREYQQHLDLASSEGALRDCQESYNPFLKKVPSSGRLITSASLEMSSNSLYGTPPPLSSTNINTTSQLTILQQQHQQQQQLHQQQQQQHQQQFLLQQQQIQNQHHQALLLSDTPRDSPKIFRRHSGGGIGDRRGSDKSTPEKDKIQQLQLLQQQQQQQQQQFMVSVNNSSGNSGGGCGGGGNNTMGISANFIPVIATPESSPISTRRGSCKPTGLPKSPQVSRSGSTRRTNSVKGPRRNTSGYLDVPDRDNNPPVVTPDDEDEESYRLRSFSVTPKGIVNRGDSFRRRRSRSNSLIPTPTTPEPQRNGPFTSEDGLLLPSNVYDSSSSKSPMPSPKSPMRPSSAMASPTAAHSDHDVNGHRCAMMGARGVGKTALISQFMTSECINAYDHDRQNDVEGEETVSVMLDGEESELTFFKMNNPKTELNRSDPPDAFVLVYSVVDRSSFQRAETELRRLQEWDLLRTKAVVLVANKIDLARSRAVSTTDGRCLAVSFRVKFMEISVGINHNVDELLVGILHQIRLKGTQTGNQDSWCKHRGILRASVKARQMLTWLLGKEDAKFKNCENLHIL